MLTQRQLMELSKNRITTQINWFLSHTCITGCLKVSSKIKRTGFPNSVQTKIMLKQADKAWLLHQSCLVLWWHGVWGARILTGLPGKLLTLCDSVSFLLGTVLLFHPPWAVGSILELWGFDVWKEKCGCWRFEEKNPFAVFNVSVNSTS